MNSSIFFNKSFRFAALASAVALGAFGASNSFAASVPAPTTATVITPISIANNDTLAFGRFAASGTVGTVIITTAGVRSKTNGVTLSDADSTSNAATFQVTGDGNAAYGITWENTPLTSTDAGAATMALARISDLDGSSSSTTAVDVSTGALTTGAQTIFLGGILSVGIDQIAGTYEGTVTATVEYN